MTNRHISFISNALSLARQMRDIHNEESPYSNSQIVTTSLADEMDRSSLMRLKLENNLDKATTGHEEQNLSEVRFRKFVEEKTEQQKWRLPLCEVLRL